MIIAKTYESLLADPKHQAEIMKLMKQSVGLRAMLMQELPADEFYAQRRGDLLKAFHQEQSKIKFEKNEMELAYTDSEGHFYNRFPEKLGLPIERFGKMKFFLMWMVSGISPSELDALLDKADEALGAGIKDPKNAAMIGMVHTEIRGRKRLTIHTELLYNFLACQWVRDDENPLIYNNEIQLEKVETFKRENARGNSYFFFQQKELKMLSRIFKMSEEEWNKFWQESLSHQEFLKAFRLMKFSSGTEGGE